MKKTYSKVTTCLLDFLDKGEDNFFTLTDLYDDRDKYSRDTEYHLIAENILTQQLILGRVGTIQDMHILLTLNQMGIADIRSLARMYGKIASLNKELNMNQTSLEENIELISKRLSALSKVGYIVTVKLTNHAYSSEIRSNECYLYMVASRAAGICGNILQRRFVVDGTLFTKPVGDIQLRQWSHQGALMKILAL